MFDIISNEKRKYFGLAEIKDNWKKIKVESKNFDGFDVTIYVDDLICKKCIISGPSKYTEMEMDWELSKNLDSILPKDANKKPSTLDSIINKSASGVVLSFNAPNIAIFNDPSKITYYSNYFEDDMSVNDIESFKVWLNSWCEESTESDLIEIAEFAKKTKPEKVKFKDGDVFRLKLSRRLYGYGRVLLDYNKMRKNKEMFWDCMMGTPVVASLYHILTEDKDVSAQNLKNLMSFPSEIIMDTNLTSGNYKIIGNIPVDYKNDDFPIMYGSDFPGKDTTNFQRGKTYVRLENKKPLYSKFKNNGVNSHIGEKLSVMKKCIEEKSNNPVFEKLPEYARNDLRDPKNAKELGEILVQVGLN